MYSRLETFVDEPRAFVLLWIKLSELAIHASFTREFSPATRPFSPSLLSLALSFLFFRFTSRHQRPGQIRIHCGISLERLLEERKSSSPSVLQFLLAEGERTRIPIGIKRPSLKDFVRFQLIFIISPALFPKFPFSTLGIKF